jgi:coenzyme F420-reducing hydrogenase delta subunit/ferredoxin
MSEANKFEPKIVAYVCNWCTYLGADLAGTTRLEYPSNVRIIRLPCTGRIDFNLLVKAFEIGADAVLVSGCHPGDCHYTAGNYHARRRWILFRELLDTLGFDLRRIHFTWISAAEGRKWQEEVTRITEETRQLGPYSDLYKKNGSKPVGVAPGVSPALNVKPKPAALEDITPMAAQEQQLRETCRKLLSEGTVQVVIGYGAKGPAFIRRAEDADRLVWNAGCQANLTVYLKRKEIKRLGKAAAVVKGCDERALVILEKEFQLDRQNVRVIGMACDGMNQPKCAACEVHQPRFADEVIGHSTAQAHQNAAADPLAGLMQMSPAERMSWWAGEFERCVKCYACRQVCPLCYCERCIVDKNRPVAIDTSATLQGNFAWHITRAFHLAGRCVGCGECTRACPAGIPLNLLNITLAQAAEKHFGYRAGMDPKVDPLIGTYALTDKEEFIR